MGEGRGRAQQVPDDPSPGLQTGAACGQPEACSSLRSRGNAGHGPGDDEKTGRGAAKREVIALRAASGGINRRNSPGTWATSCLSGRSLSQEWGSLGTN